ncbi:MAG: tyrosine-type recombinase/integrase [Pseudomonadota bacterium]
MAKLTTIELKALRAEDAGKKLREDGGLIGVVRAGTGGVTVSFDWRYRFAGKVRQIAVGSFPKSTIAEIRAKRDKFKHTLDAGKDPAEEKRIGRLQAQADQAEAVSVEQARITEAEAVKARMTVRELFERWEKSVLGERKDKGAEVRRSFTKDVLPVLGGVAVEDVKRAMIASLLDNVVDRGARIVARELLGELRMMFNYAIKRELIEHNPTALLKRDDFGKKVERDRILSDAEIRILPGKLVDAHMAESSTAAIWIMLSTCCRVGEISRAEWKDVDLVAGTWRIPPENAKNAKTHTIYLSPFAVRRFEALKALAEGSTWVLPARWENKEGQRVHVCVKSLAKQIGDRQRGDKPPMACRSLNINALELPGGKWTPHDLRRTGATTMGALGVRPDVIEKCLNHVEQNKVVRIYQRQELKAEQAEAWRLLGERLELLMRDDDSVVLLRSA